MLWMRLRGWCWDGRVRFHRDGKVWIGVCIGIGIGARKEGIDVWRCNHVLRIVDRIIQRRNLPTVRCMYSTYKSPRSNTTTRKNIPTSLHMSKTHTDTYVRTRNPINPSLNPPHSIPIQKPTIPTTPNPPLHVIPPIQSPIPHPITDPPIRNTPPSVSCQDPLPHPNPRSPTRRARPHPKTATH